MYTHSLFLFLFQNHNFTSATLSSVKFTQHFVLIVIWLLLAPPNRDSLKALLIVSKLIQNIANGIVKNNITHYSKHETKIKSFIERHMNDIKKFCDSLIVRWIESFIPIHDIETHSRHSNTFSSMWI
jgi:hypothetical protein